MNAHQRYSLSLEETCRKAVSLRDAGRLHDAEALIEAVFLEYPHNDAVLVHRAIIAERLGDMDGALRRWALVRSTHPHNPYGYLNAAAVLNSRGQVTEAEALMLEGLQMQPGNIDLLAAYARIVPVDNPGEALRRWAVVKAQHPGSPIGYVSAAKILMQGNRLEEAEGVLSIAARSFPDDLDTMSTFAWLALHRQDWEAALKRWKAFSERFDDSPGFYIGFSMAMREAGALDDTEALLVKAKAKYPDDPNIASEYAALPERSQDFNTAVGRWMEARDRFGELPLIHGRLIAALQYADRLDEARVALAGALSRFPDDIEIIRAEAMVAKGQKDLAGSAAAWRRLLEKFPDNNQAISGLGAALRESGQLEDSAALLKNAAERLPDDLDLNYQYALTLTEQRTWMLALPVWARLKKQHKHPVVASGVAIALWQAKLDLADREVELAQLQPTLAALEDFADDKKKSAAIELFSSFESLGDDCEFGMVQRRFGSEPLSLLRWTGTPPGLLAEALRAEFDGVGDADHSELKVVNGEFIILTSRYEMIAHTFVFESSVSAEKFFPQQIKRISFLRRKILEDLRAAEKIFVYKYRFSLTDEQIDDLYSSMLQYSPDSKLLCVKLADDDHQSGTAVKAAPGLVVGYLQHFSTVDIRVADWEAVCRTTKELLGQC